MQPDLPPSVLDSPRFFDDETLSAWKLVGDGQENTFVASVSGIANAVNVVPVTSNDAIATNEVEDGDPISVELVRGLDGPNDEEWKLVVNGVVQTEGSASFRRDPENERRFVCTLPEPLNDVEKATKVRPLAIAVRLENEALAPLQTIGQAFQSLVTNEHYKQPGQDRKECGDAFFVHSYRTSSVESKAVHLPYPTWSAPHPAIGIVNFSKKEEDADKQRLAAATSAVRQVLDARAEAAFQGRKQAAELFNKGVTSTDGVAKVVQASLKAYNSVVDKDGRVSTAVRNGFKLPAPKRPVNLSTYVPSLDEAFTHMGEKGNVNSAQATSYVVGGSTTSAIYEMKFMIDMFILAYRSLNDEIDDSIKNKTLPEKLAITRLQFIQMMRVHIDRMFNNAKMSAFFDALLSSPINTAMVLVTLRDMGFKYKYKFEECDEKNGHKVPKTITPLIDETKVKSYRGTKLVEYYKKIKKIVDDGKTPEAPFDFVYDRLSLNTLSRTLIQTFVEITVSEFEEGHDTTFVLETKQQHGLEAHATYDGLKDQLKELDDACDAFLDMFHEIWDHYSEDSQKNLVTRTYQAVGTALANYARKVVGKGGVKLPKSGMKGTLAILALLASNNETVVVGDGSKLELPPQWLKIDLCVLQERLAQIRGAAYSSFPIPTDTQEDFDRFQGAIQKINEEIPKEQDGGASTSQSGADEEQAELLLQEELEFQLERSNEIAALETLTLGQYASFVSRTLPQIVLDESRLTYRYSSYEYTTPIVQRTDKPPTSGGFKAPLAFLAVFTGAGYKFWSDYQVAYAQQLEEAFLSRTLETALSIFTAGNAQIAVSLARWVTGFLSYTDQSAYETLLRFGPALYQGIRSSVTLGSNLVEYYRLRQSFDEQRWRIYMDHRTRLLGEPIKSCVSSARNCMRQYVNLMQRQEKDLFGVSDSVIVMYKPSNGKRFAFRQLYGVQSSDDALDNLPSKFDVLHLNNDWTNVPNSNALSLIPPDSVAYKLYECENMRDIMMEEYETLVAGRHSGIPLPRTPSQLAAQSAVLEARQVVRRWRKQVNGEHLTTPEIKFVIELVARACKIIKVVYGSQAGMTLVAGDDLLWTCLRSGSFARLALRHLPLFQSMMVMQAKGIAPFMTYYKIPRRRMMLEFVDALKAESQTLQKLAAASPMTTRVLQISDVSTQVAISFHRVLALMQGNVPPERVQCALCIVASAAAHDILVVRTTKDDVQKALDAFRALVRDAMQENAPVLQYANSIFPPLSTVPDNAWSARRVDTNVVKNWAVATNEPGAIDRLTQLLSPLSISADKKAVFYCPMGSILERAPPQTPFLVQSLSRREVVMHDMQITLRDLYDTGAVVDKEGDAGDVTVRVDSFGTSSNVFPVGVARHPLAIQLDEKDGEASVMVHLSEKHTDDDGNDENARFERRVETLETKSEYDANRIPEVVQTVLSGDVDHESIRNRMMAARRMGFDSERLLFGVLLAKQRLDENRSPIVVVNARSYEQVVSFAIAASMAFSLYGYSPNNYKLVVENVEEARRTIEHMRQKVDSAMDVGVESCLLCEFTTCML